MSEPALPGALEGLRVIELAGELVTWAGKLLADMGAQVVKVEPPTGDAMRSWEPYLDDIPGPERSLAYWHYNTSKLGVTLDLGHARGRELFRRLTANCDILLESEHPGRMAELGLDYHDLAATNPGLIYVSVTPFGRTAPRAEEPATDLTILAGGGIAWMNGYDDHSLPPVRGGGNQGLHTASHYALMCALVALLERDVSGQGQHIDVNAHAAANVTNEAGSYTWLVSRQTVQRQTGRHAGVSPSMPSQIECADGRHVNTGLPPRRGHDFKRLYEWLESLGALDEFPLSPLLELGAQRERIDLATIAEDPEAQAIFGAGRDAFNFIASKVTAYEFFTGAQARGFQVGVIYAPEEAIEDVHFKARGFPTPVDHPEFGRTIVYPGAPYRFTKSPWRIRRRAPLLGEDNAAVFGALGVSPEELGALRTAGVI